MRRRNLKILLLLACLLGIGLQVLFWESNIGSPLIYFVSFGIGVLLLNSHSERLLDAVLERFSAPAYSMGGTPLTLDASSQGLAVLRRRALRRHLRLIVLVLVGQALLLLLLNGGDGWSSLAYTLTAAFCIGIVWVLRVDDWRIRGKDMLFHVVIEHDRRGGARNVFTRVDNLCLWYWILPKRAYEEKVLDVLALQPQLRRWAYFYPVVAAEYYAKQPERWLRLALVALLISSRDEIPLQSRQRLEALWEQGLALGVHDVQQAFIDFHARLLPRYYGLRKGVEHVLDHYGAVARIAVEGEAIAPDLRHHYLHEPSLN